MASASTRWWTSAGRTPQLVCVGQAEKEKKKMNEPIFVVTRGAYRLVAWGNKEGFHLRVDFHPLTPIRSLMKGDGYKFDKNDWTLEFFKGAQVTLHPYSPEREGGGAMVFGKGAEDHALMGLRGSEFAMLQAWRKLYEGEIKPDEFIK